MEISKVDKKHLKISYNQASILHQLAYFMVTISFAEIFISIQLCEFCMNKIN